MAAGCSGGTWRGITTWRRARRRAARASASPASGSSSGCSSRAKSSPKRGAAPRTSRRGGTWPRAIARRGSGFRRRASPVRAGRRCALRLTNPLSPLLDAGYLEEAHPPSLRAAARSRLRRPARPALSATASRSKSTARRWRASRSARAGPGRRSRSVWAAGACRRPSRLFERHDAACAGRSDREGIADQHVRQGDQERLGLAGARRRRRRRASAG